jgi:CRP-like cAMP-binding protein
MPIDSAAPTGNRLLDALPDTDRALIAAHLESVSLAKGAVVIEAGADVTHVTFPCAHTVIALIITTRDGRTAETVTIGREGAVGGVVSQGRVPATADAVVQIGGDGVRLDVDRLQEALGRSASLRDLFARYADCFVTQLLQVAACNALHPIEQRCLRWLLTLQDRLDSDILPVTHEVLAAMLGVQRTYLTRILRTLQNQGLIQVGRGRITVVDRVALSAAACECHARVRTHCETVLGSVYAPEALPGGAPLATAVRASRP